MSAGRKGFRLPQLLDDLRRFPWSSTRAISQRLGVKPNHVPNLIRQAGDRLQRVEGSGTLLYALAGETTKPPTPPKGVIAASRRAEREYDARIRARILRRFRWASSWTEHDLARDLELPAGTVGLASLLRDLAREGHIAQDGRTWSRA